MKLPCPQHIKQIYNSAQLKVNLIEGTTTMQNQFAQEDMSMTLSYSYKNIFGLSKIVTHIKLKMHIKTNAMHY